MEVLKSFTTILYVIYFFISYMIAFVRNGLTLYTFKINKHIHKKTIILCNPLKHVLVYMFTVFEM